MGEIKTSGYDVSMVRSKFPILQQKINGHPLVYLDSAATTQKPQSVIDCIQRYYEMTNANVHRGIYTLSERATHQYEAARQTVKNFINARHNHEIIFTRSATEAMNLVCQSFGKIDVQAGDEVVLTVMEHHSCIVPWQVLCQERGAVLKVVDIDQHGCLDMDSFSAVLSDKTKMVCMIHVSNVLGVVNPIKKVVEQAHSMGVPVLVDGTQAIPHGQVDVQDLGCDFYVFSGHKMYGPTGVGVLYGREDWLDKMPPYQYGGDMIRSVTFEKTEFNQLPHKFEAGTMHIAGVVGLAEAIHFLKCIGVSNLSQHETELMKYARRRLQEVDGLELLYKLDDNVAVLSFTMRSAHPHDIATILDQTGVAIRAGHHCAMPLMQRMNVPATARMSFGAYSNFADIDRCIDGLNRVSALFK